MIGAIAGDMIGSTFEARPVKSTDFPLFAPGSRFTDDSVLTVAVARAILEDGDYRHHVHALAQRYPDAGYGARFVGWLHQSDARPYGSWGNGAAIRVSPVGLAFFDVDRVLAEARLPPGLLEATRAFERRFPV